jgi:hypothetical protein
MDGRFFSSGHPDRLSRSQAHAPEVEPFFVESDADPAQKTSWPSPAEQGKSLPAPPSVPRGAIARLEAQLREAIMTRCNANVGEDRAIRQAFTAIDKNGSGSVDMLEARRHANLSLPVRSL